ncbi:MAG: TadE family protein, partial [Planctomycetota bacterium]
MAKKRPTSRQAATGVALAETVMVIPLLALVLGLTFFFGWVMTNQQRVRQASRYAAWRRVVRDSGISTRTLNRTFFGDTAESVGVSGGRVGEPTLLDYAD